MPEPTHISDVLVALRFLDPEAQVTISVRVGDLQRALEAKAGGPQVVTAEQAAEHVGRTPEYWRRQAKAGRIPGAWQDAAGGPWRLPRPACEAHLRSEQAKRSRTRTGPDVSPLFSGAQARGPRQHRRPAA